MLVIIIPVKQSWVKPDCFLRLFLNLYRLKWLAKITQVQFKILIADDSVIIAKSIIFCIAKLLQCQYLDIKSGSEYYTPAGIKNIAAEYAFINLQAQSIFFLDVDVYLNAENLVDLINKDKRNVCFDWYPVDFLNKENGNFWHMCKNIKVGNLENSHLIQTGYVTGAHFMNKDFFQQLGGYNTIFSGYGCEDIEFLHRATLILGLRDKFNDKSLYFIDDRDYNPEKLVGFRNFYFQLKQKSKNEIVRSYPKHFWHKRKNQSDYLKNRKANDVIMLNLMKEFDNKF